MKKWKNIVTKTKKRKNNMKKIKKQKENMEQITIKIFLVSSKRKENKSKLLQKIKIKINFCLVYDT